MKSHVSSTFDYLRPLFKVCEKRNVNGGAHERFCVEQVVDAFSEITSLLSSSSLFIVVVVVVIDVVVVMVFDNDAH